MGIRCGSGFVTQAFRAGAEEHPIMRQTGQMFYVDGGILAVL